jgi:uncharacterized protein YcbK (DUF882 family)
MYAWRGFKMITFEKKENKQISKHFNTKEFECKCGKCDIQYIEPDLIEKLEKVRELYGKPIIITSAYRCPEHNKSIGGALNSSHVNGMAADIQPKLLILDELDELYDICYNIFDNIGDGRNKRFIHVDTRPAKPQGKRTWLYK